MRTLLICQILLCSILFARENPFEPTNAYKEEKARIVEEKEETIQDSIIQVNENIETTESIEEAESEVDENLEKSESSLQLDKPAFEKILLPFVKIIYTDDNITIQSKYKISKKITFPDAKRIVFDYDSKESFYTKREKLESENFHKIVVGSHKKENFFRIVIELIDLPQNYKISYKKDSVIISKIK